MPTCTLLALNRAKVTWPSGTLPASAAGVLVLVTVADTVTFWFDALAGIEASVAGVSTTGALLNVNTFAVDVKVKVPRV